MSADLTKFLLARIAEDEHDARVEIGRRDVILTGVFAPERVLAECRVKRLLIQRVGNPGWAGFRILVLPYVDHPDCLHEWWQ